MSEKKETIADRYQKVMDRLIDCTKNSGRDENSVKLLVVTKGQPVENMLQVYAAGARLFGENYPEETLEKLTALSKLTDIQIHMIGHLQSRKAKIVAGSFDFMHSVDRMSIVEKLDRELKQAGRRLPILLEMNVSGEETKQGFPAWDPASWSDLLPLINEIAAYESLTICGLMTMPPLTLNNESVKPYFAKLRGLRDYFAVQFPSHSWSELSMGTSADFETAIQEGATFIRVGTAIMGHRPQKK